MGKVLSFLLIVLFFASCSEYQKALKSEDVAVKAKVANEMYENGKYSKALRLYEQLAPAYKGKPQAERIFYFYSKSYYLTKQYYLAAYQFENFAASYPKSEKREEASFLAAECYYRLSPRFSLDQVDTDKALTKLQKFIDLYPNSEYLPKANEYVKELTDKLEEKAFKIAKQYHDIADYRFEYATAIKALDNFILDYPGTKYKEEAMYYKFDSAYKLAMNSIPSKKEERLNVAKTYYNSLMKFKADSAFKDKADDKLAMIDKELQQYSKQ
ncbi:outer membrane protein assembly factor BamD [Flavobacterium chuncheonense]|uniref:Outer membrane protein assembly factor BamD n=1 Tax=Flavobacterium chuncheonense TaxID=2026653 RepID=A0ABW5YLJ8_9FLAO